MGVRGWGCVGPVALGFVLGSLLSLTLFPLPLPEPDPLCVDEPMEAVIHTPPQQGGPSKRPPIPRQKPKLQRPRFFASELGIRDKLFLGLLTSPRTLATLATAQNHTGSHHVSRMSFFSNAPLSVPPPLNVVAPTESLPPHLHIFFVLSHIHNNGLAEHYDWFFFAPDSTYVKAFKLFELVSHISVGRDLILGQPTEASPRHCDLSSGILLSSGIMERLGSQLSDCRAQADADADDSANLGACLDLVTDAACQESRNGKSLRSWRLEDAVEDLISANSAERVSAFNAALTVGPVHAPGDIHALHHHACLHELHTLSALTNSIQTELRNRSFGIPGLGSWPFGVPAPARARTRYEAFRWEFFTPTTLFPNSADTNSNPLSGVDANDVEQILAAGRKHLSSERPTLDAVGAVATGYRRFDPTRGMDYILDFAAAGERTERVHLSRPLSRAELVPVPYVTEKKEVLLVVPVHAHEVAAARKFLDRFAEICLDAGDESRLLFVLVTPNAESSVSGAQNADFALLIQDIRLIRSQFGEKNAGSSKVRVLRLRGTYQAIKMMGEVVDKNGGEILYLLASPWVELHQDFVNRVRMHTIIGFQVFFPIPFAQFNPAITRHFDSLLKDAPQEPAEIVVHKTSGRFDSGDVSVGSFYGADLKRAMGGAEGTELADLFASADVHLMRAVEPSLKIAFHATSCGAEEPDLDACTRSRALRQGSRAQLASLVLRAQLNASDMAILAKKNRA